MRFLQLFLVVILVIVGSVAEAAQVTLRWTPSDPEPDGYYLFHRVGDAEYDYDSPLIIEGVTNWRGQIDPTKNQAVIPNLSEISGKTVSHYFVIRSYVKFLRSGDSNEVVYKTGPGGLPSPSDFVVTFDHQTQILSVSFSQDQSTPIAYWKVYYSFEQGGEHQEFTTIQKTDSNNRTVSASEPFTAVGKNQRKNVFLVVVAFASDTLFSANSQEIMVEVDRRIPQPPVLHIEVEIPVN